MRILIAPLLISPAVALASPAPVDLDPEGLARLCAEVAQRPVEDETPFERVYRVTADPKSVRFSPYDTQEEALPLALEHALVALDGAVVISVMDRRGGAFSITEAEAQGLLAKADKEELRLVVEFQVDRELAEEVSPCFSYAKSETYSLRVAPLSYALTDVGGKNVLARVRTDRMEESGPRLTPGEATVRIVPRVRRGVVDLTQLASALEARRADLESCVAGVIESTGQTGVVGLIASITNGRITDARPEMEAFDDPQIVPCLQRTLEQIKPPQASRETQIGVVVAVDRGRAVN